MIFGIGTDIVQVSRIRRNLERYGDRFAGRILGDGELADYRTTLHPARFLARRFAVKEALAKACGTGFTQGLTFRDITVAHDSAGKPELRVAGRAAELYREKGIGESFVSISDEREYAVAFVTLLRKTGGSR
ncbi:MAG: holo-ACP synthase [Gammaproteobacteria bacterium]|jgi:holo-[acyl-carrier protein] synthase